MIEYTFGTGLTVQLDIPASYLAYQGDISQHGYSYTLGSNDLKEPRLNPSNVSVPFTGTWQEYDKILRHSEADMASGNAGTVSVNGWSKRAQIVGTKHKRSAKGRILTEIQMALLDGAWWRVKGVSLMPGSGTGSGGLDYAHDFDYDYQRPSVGGAVNTGSLIPCKPKLIFYGPITNPYIIIAGNRYEVEDTLAAGARIEVDGKYKTVRKIAQDGTVTDKFADAHRGTGEGGGEYIFQPIPSGDQGITWDDSFGVDVKWYEEVSEVPWNQS